MTARSAILRAGPAVAAAAIGLGGCAGAGGPAGEAGAAPNGRANPASGSPRVQGRATTMGGELVLPAWPLPAWPGTTLVIPMTGWAGREAPVVRDDRGGALASSVWALEVSPVAPTWNGVESRWHAVRLETGPARGERADGPGPTPAGAITVLAVDLPPAFHAEEIVVGSRRIPVATSPAMDESAWRSPFPAYSDWAPLLDGIRADESNPLLRWRGGLLRAGVPEDPTRPAPDVESGVVEALAVQEELRWRVALSRLEEASPELCAQVRATLLAGVSDQESGQVVPLWTQQSRPLEQLLDILLNDRLNPTALVERARTWNDRQAVQTGWLDRAFAEPLAGAPPAGEGGARLGVVRAWAGNTGSEAALAWLEVRGGRPIGAVMPEPRLLAPGELGVLEAPVRIEQGAEVVEVRIHVGSQVVRDSVVVGALEAGPPGVVIGPLAPVLSAQDVLSGDGSPESRSSACAGLLRRVDPSGLAPGEVAARSNWAILLDVSDSLPQSATIDLLFDHDGGRTSVRVSRDGTLVLRAPVGLPTAGFPGQARVAGGAGIWTIDVPVPDWCVGTDGRLKIGLMLDAGAGGRWTWPGHATLRDRAFVGLGVVDLGTWDVGAASLAGASRSAAQ